MKTAVANTDNPAMITGSERDSVSSAPVTPIDAAAASARRGPYLSIQRPDNGVTIAPRR